MRRVSERFLHVRERERNEDSSVRIAFHWQSVRRNRETLIPNPLRPVPYARYRENRRFRNRRKRIRFRIGKGFRLNAGTLEKERLLRPKGFRPRNEAVAIANPVCQNRKPLTVPNRPRRPEPKNVFSRKLRTPHSGNRSRGSGIGKTLKTDEKTDACSSVSERFPRIDSGTAQSPHWNTGQRVFPRYNRGKDFPLPDREYEILSERPVLRRRRSLARTAKTQARDEIPPRPRMKGIGFRGDDERIRKAQIEPFGSADVGTETDRGKTATDGNGLPPLDRSSRLDLRIDQNRRRNPFGDSVERTVIRSLLRGDGIAFERSRFPLRDARHRHAFEKTLVRVLRVVSLSDRDIRRNRYGTAMVRNLLRLTVPFPDNRRTVRSLIRGARRKDRRRTQGSLGPFFQKDGGMAVGFSVSDFFDIFYGLTRNPMANQPYDARKEREIDQILKMLLSPDGKGYQYR